MTAQPGDDSTGGQLSRELIKRLGRLCPVADIARLGQDAGMTAARAFILQALHRVIDGGDIGEIELNLGVPDPLLLDRAEKSAWEELSHWADDDDIRARDKRYAASRRERMRDRLAALKVDGS